MLGTAILVATALAEFLIFVYVFGYVCTYVIPWDDMREKRLIRARVAKLIPLLQERAASIAKRCLANKKRVRALKYRKLAGSMTADIARLSTRCQQTIASITQEYKMWPKESLQMSETVTSTLDALEYIMTLRDEELPELIRLMAETVFERMDGLESLRKQLWDRVVAEEKDGIAMSYESRRLVMLANSFSSHRLLVGVDPDAVASLLPSWGGTMRAIAESIEVRSAVLRRVREVRAEVPTRVKRVRELADAVRPVFAEKREVAPHESAGARVALVRAAESAIVRAEKELRRAEEGIAREAHDVGAKGDSSKRLMIAFRAAGVSVALLESFEKDLLTVIAALAVSRAKDSDNVN